tara:strand:+ start:464 stop:2023 length:1560 start_codon:yes stop_codon:yes gene_type:complete
MAVSISGEGAISGSSSYSFDSNVSIAGTTTIEDVTSVDSVGIITAQSGIHVTGGTVGIGTDDPGIHKLHLYGATNSDIRMTATGDDIINIFANSNRSSANDTLFAIKAEWNGTQVGNIKINAGDDTTNKDDGYITFFTRESGAGSSTERLRIASTGRVAIGNATNNASPTALFGVIADDGEAADLYVGKFHNLEATAGQSYGVDIRAGSNSTDHGFRVKNRANDATQFLVRGDGNVGINESSPGGLLQVGASSGSHVIITPNTGIDINDGQLNLYAATTNVNSAPFIISSDVGGTEIEKLRFTAGGKLGIGSDAPTQALDVVGRITKTEYEPGEIIEQIASFCDGSSHTVKSGTYTMANVTAEQTGSTSDATASGSSINYTPPLGTKRIHYQYWFKWEATERSGISHFWIQVDASDVVISRRTKATNYSRYDSTYYHHGEEWYCMSCVLECDASSTDTSEGQYAGWATNQETKDIRVRFREYSGSYEISLHGNHYWDGSTASGTNQKPIKPMLIVTAIA